MSVDVTKMPKLGFGLMRLPEKDGSIDLQAVCDMVDAYLDAGFNYFDTAYVYHGGNSEKAVKEALMHGTTELMHIIKMRSVELS